MTAKLWFIYLGLFLIASFLDAVGGGTFSIGNPDDVNAATTYQVDEEPSGSGFLGLPRVNLTFVLNLVPKFVTWNFGFFTGDLQFVQYIMIFMFGGLLMITWGSSLLGLLQRSR